MSDWVMAGGGGQWNNSIVDATGTDYGVTCTTNASANTKGSYAALTASLPISTQGGFWWHISTTTGVFDHSFDLAVGAAASEKIVVPDLFLAATAEICNSFYIPLELPAGARVSVRGQSTTGAKTSAHSISPFNPGWLSTETPQRSESLGVTTAANTRGMSVTPSATADTKGSWATIGTTTFDWHWMLIMLGYQQSTSRTGSNCRLDIGRGAGPTVILPNLRYRNCNTTQEPVRPRFIGPFQVSIPSGVSLSARSQASAASALAIDVTLTGFGA